MWPQLFILHVLFEMSESSRAFGYMCEFDVNIWLFYDILIKQFVIGWQPVLPHHVKSESVCYISRKNRDMALDTIYGVCVRYKCILLTKVAVLVNVSDAKSHSTAVLVPSEWNVYHVYIYIYIYIYIYHILFTWCKIQDSALPTVQHLHISRNMHMDYVRLCVLMVWYEAIFSHPSGWYDQLQKIASTLESK